jgi:hypothetical protein
VCPAAICVRGRAGNLLALCLWRSPRRFPSQGASSESRCTRELDEDSRWERGFARLRNQYRRCDVKTRRLTRWQLDVLWDEGTLDGSA